MTSASVTKCCKFNCIKVYLSTVYFYRVCLNGCLIRVGLGNLENPNLPFVINNNDTKL